jgi:metal-responsive CopG/Arc/MetJ family transcriptional regulator
MANIKTAISIQKTLFEQAEDLARKMKIPRSRLFMLALEDYLRLQENKALLARINTACVDEPERAEQTLRRKARRRHRRLVEGEW